MLNYLGATEMQTGSTGADVRETQDLLTRRGYSPGPVDGIFGEKTKLAVMRFQSDRGITIDGIVGAVTWAALHGNIAQPTTLAPAPAPVKKPPVSLPSSLPLASAPVGLAPGGFMALSPTVIVIGGLGLLTALSVFTGSGPRTKRRRARR